MGERQGNLVSSANAMTPDQVRVNRASGKSKSMNFGTYVQELHVLRQARALHAIAYVAALQSRYDRLVAEIGPWMLVDRKRRASTCKKSSSSE